MNEEFEQEPKGLNGLNLLSVMLICFVGMFLVAKYQMDLSNKGSLIVGGIAAAVMAIASYVPISGGGPGP